MDTIFFIKAYDFLYKTFSNPKQDFDEIFAEFPETVRGPRKSEWDTQLFSFNTDIEYILLMFLRMGFPMLKTSDLETGNLDFIIDSGPSSRWISIPSETPSNTWSMFVDCIDELDRKKFVLGKMVEVISTFQPLVLCIMKVNDFYSEQLLLLEEGKVVLMKDLVKNLQDESKLS